MRVLLFIAGIFLSAIANAEIVHEESERGDLFVYIPDETPKNMVVIAHGMLSKDEPAAEAARTYLNRWIPYADQYELLVIAPVFDTPRFGNLGGGYGGYRNLFGKNIAADKFVNDAADRYSSRTSSESNQFYLYGHSAGAQFVNRYVVTHPNRVIKAVVSASGRYSYPNQSAPWPYGAGNLIKYIQWNDGSKREVSVTPMLSAYAKAAGKVDIVIGEEDTKPQPERPAHRGKTRIELAQSWAEEMNQNAKRYGLNGNVNVYIIPGIGHDSAKLTPYCARVLLDP